MPHVQPRTRARIIRTATGKEEGNGRLNLYDRLRKQHPWLPDQSHFDYVNITASRKLRADERGLVSRDHVLNISLSVEIRPDSEDVNYAIERASGL